LAVNEIVQGQIINIDGKCLCGSDNKALGNRSQSAQTGENCQRWYPCQTTPGWLEGKLPGQGSRFWNFDAIALADSFTVYLSPFSMYTYPSLFDLTVEAT
jgi:hypothetical protein